MMQMWQVLAHLGYRVNQDFGLIDNDGVVSIDWWSHADPQPTPEQIEAARLPAMKADIWTRIKAERDRREEGGFPYQGKIVDSDPRSVQRIGIAVQAAQAALAFGAPFSIDWTCKDNTTLSLDAAGVIGMPVALAQFANGLHTHSRALRSLVDAAEDPATVNIEAGWPE